jgi:hypothetical protein
VSILTLAAKRAPRAAGGPTQYVPLRDAVTDDEAAYQIARSATGDEPYIVSARHAERGQRDPVTLVNERNTERYRIDMAAKAVAAMLGDDDDEQTAARDALAALVTDGDDDDASAALVVIDNLPSDDGQRVSALAATSDALVKARKSLPKVNAEPSARIASALALYAETETDTE